MPSESKGGEEKEERKMGADGLIGEGESPTSDGGDHSHSFYDTYKVYLEHFERRVEQHIVAAGATVGDFMAALLATTEYETFIVLMMNEAKRIRKQRNDEAESKDGHKWGGARPGGGKGRGRP
ncbi:hypothetical protein JL721_382 [Aureococcus anophagefferens]|nr:hypothetical protein JL721_382 [Aureococcus anophagefferens]